MNNLQKKYFDGLTMDSLIKIIGENFYSLKGVLNAYDFNFEESKGTIFETIELIERRLTALQEKINKI